MASKKTDIRRSSKAGQFIVGGMASAKISKVEGMTLTKDMRTTFRDFEKKSMPPAARRAALINKYGKKGS
jgi:hypothetical protein